MIWNCVWFVLWYEIIYDVICLKQTETIGQRNGTPYWPCLYWHLIRTLTLWTHTFPKINMSPKSRDYFNRDIHHHTSCNHWFSGARFVSRRVPPLEFKSVCVFLEVEEKREEQITRIYIYNPGHCKGCQMVLYQGHFMEWNPIKTPKLGWGRQSSAAKNQKNVSDGTMCIHVLVASLMFHQLMRMCTCAKLKIEDVWCLWVSWVSDTQTCWTLLATTFIHIHSYQANFVHGIWFQSSPTSTHENHDGKLHAEVGRHWATKWLFHSAAYDGW